MSKPPKKVDWQKRLTGLKKLGVIHTGNLSSIGKDRIYRLTKKFARELNKPDDFQRIRAKDIGKYKKAGLKTSGNLVFVPKEGYQTVRSDGRRLIYEREEKNGVRKTRTVGLNPPADLFADVRKKFANKKPGETVYIKVSGFYDFGVPFESEAAFEQYFHDKVTPFLMNHNRTTRDVRVYVTKHSQVNRRKRATRSKKNRGN